MALIVTFSTGPLPLSGCSAPAVSTVSSSVPSHAMVDKVAKVGSLLAVKELHEESDGTRHATRYLDNLNAEKGCLKSKQGKNLEMRTKSNVWKIFEQKLTPSAVAQR